MATATREHVPTAMVFGKSGMGKSYLCNCLLYCSPRSKQGFGTAAGREPVTSECEGLTVARTEPPPCPPGHDMGVLKPGGPLQMIDTPGIPDPSGRTLRFYDEIVRTLQDIGGLNAFIMAFNDTTDRESMRKDIELYRILLKQFANLPMYQILVCRVRLDQWASTEQQTEDLERTKEWVTDVLSKAGMASAQQVYIREGDPTMMVQYFKLRSIVTDKPWTPIGNWNIKTYAELKAAQKSLTDFQTRKAALVERRRSLESQKKDLDESIAALEGKIEDAKGAKKWSLPVAAGLAATGVGLIVAGIGGLIFHGVHSDNQDTFAQQLAKNVARKEEVETELADIARELNSGETNYGALEEDEKILHDLEKIAFVL